MRPFLGWDRRDKPDLLIDETDGAVPVLHKAPRLLKPKAAGQSLDWSLLRGRDEATQKPVGAARSSDARKCVMGCDGGSCGLRGLENEIRRKKMVAASRQSPHNLTAMGKRIVGFP